MSRTFMTATAVVLFTTGFSAQAADPSHNPAIKDGTARSTSAPAHGANSFTERQAQGRLAKAGYSNISPLKKNDDGQWTGTATHNGAQVTVALDYKGNITAQ